MPLGKYRGADLHDVPTDYLEWAASHMPLDAHNWDAVMAERCRRVNRQRVAEETSLQRLLERPFHAFNKIVARVHLALTGY